MKKDKQENVGKDCTLGLSDSSYEIKAHSETNGGQYLVQANGYYEGSIQYGWVNEKEVKIKKWNTLKTT